MNKPKSCKCGGKRLPRGTLCYKCHLEHQRELKARAKARKIVSKARKVSKSALSTKSLDKLWREATKDYYGRRCMKCGSTFCLNSHHIIGRSNHGVRWDYRNAAILCVDCHYYNRQWSAHNTPLAFSDFIRELRGKEWYLDLLVRARNLQPDRTVYLEELKNLNL